MTESAPGRSRHLVATVVVGAAAVALLALLALLGWVLDSDALRSFDPGASSMKFNTALGLLAGAGSLALLALRPALRGPQLALGGALLAIGTATALEYALGVDFGIDELLFEDRDSPTTVDPGRPAPNTAGALVLLGLSLVAGRRARLRIASDACALAVALLALIVLGGFVTGTSEYRTISELTEMAIPTALCLAVLGFGRAAVPPEAGFGSLLVADGAAGRLVRGLLPAALLAPPLLGALFATIEGTGLIDDRVRLLLLVISLMLLMGIGVIAASRAIGRRDRERERLIGELQSANRDLESSNRQLEEFAQIASHDLREPLLVVEGFAGLLQRRAVDRLDDESGRFLENIVTGVDRMQLMIDGLLEYARVGRGALLLGQVPMNEVAREAVEHLTASIAESGGEVVVDELPTLAAERSGMVQILQNLIGNGLKFATDASPLVRVRAERRAGGWEFSVEDNGVGITPENREAAFEMFRRFHPAATPGSGIGLATCRRIVERHGGEIWVDAGPDGGSVFRFTIPDEPRTRAAQAPVEPPPASRTIT